ncbi:MAG: DUF4367 domain-containing protein [Blautia sp.]|nr:DUF4367 domain-containing protein [Blautia sp.]MDY5032365.1 DUF4367 domain-containing protein [Blautia sp.]
MEKKNRDDELKKFLDEEFIKEADLMEEALFSDEELDDIELSDEEIDASYDKLVQRLKADGVYREEASEELTKETLKMDSAVAADTSEEIAAEKPGRRKYIFPLARVAVFVVVCTLGVLLAAMTSEANRKYFVNTMKYLTNKDVDYVIGNDVTNEDGDLSEDEARVEIEQKLNIKVPEFMYRPEGFEYYNFEVYSDVGVALIEYSYQNKIILLYIVCMDKEGGSENFSASGKNKEAIEISYLDIPVYIERIEDEGDMEPTFSAHFEKDDVSYRISGKMEKDEFYELIKNICM